MVGDLMPGEMKAFYVSSCKEAVLLTQMLTTPADCWQEWLKHCIASSMVSILDDMPRRAEEYPVILRPARPDGRFEYVPLR